MNTRILLTPITLCLFALTGVSGQIIAQDAELTFDLATIFALGNLLLDENNDGFPDRLGATILLSPTPTHAETVAAAEIAARLGMETMALDLPLQRGIDANHIAIIVGMNALDQAGFSPEDTGLSGQTNDGGVVATLERNGSRWVAVLGTTDDALLRAARLFAGELPHVGTLSDPSLSDIASDMAEWLRTDTVATPFDVRFVSAVTSSTDMSVTLVADLIHPNATITSQAIDRLEALALLRRDTGATEPDSMPLRYAGVRAIVTRFAGTTITLPTLADPPPPGPIPARPGSGAKKSLDLSNMYTSDGLLGDSDNDEILDRIDALVVPSATAAGVLDFTARLGLEATGLTVPLLKRPETIDDASKQPTLVLVGYDHPLITTLTEEAKVDIDSIPAGHGLIQLVPKAFGKKPALVITGSDRSGAAMAIRQVTETFPFVTAAGQDGPTFDDLEYELWGTLSGHTPAGQAAIGLYKLDKIIDELSETNIASAEILISLEKPAEGFSEFVTTRAARLGAPVVSVTIDNRDVQKAATIFDERFDVPSEVDRFWSAFESNVMSSVSTAEPVRIEVRLSEGPEKRQAIAAEITHRLIGVGVDSANLEVQVLSAFKQGFSWLRESVAPRVAGNDIDEIVIEFLRNEAPKDWPQQAMQTPLRWLHEIFPIDEILSDDLAINQDRIRFEMVEDGPTYAVRVSNPSGVVLLEDTFDPKWVLRPYFDRFQDYEHVRVTTGWLRATSGEHVLVDQRIVTDPEWFWDYYQAKTLPTIYDYVMDRHDGNPRGAGQDAPFFGELLVELELSEPDYRLGIDNEIIAPMDALHEEIYFGTIEFFHLIGRNARGQDLTYPGRIIPVVKPITNSAAGHGRVRLTGFATSRPAVVIRYETTDGQRGERRLDIPKITMERPSLRKAIVGPESPRFKRLDFRVRVDSENDRRTEWLHQAPSERVDATMLSAEQVSATLTNLHTLRERGLYTEVLAYADVGDMGVWAEWTHEQDPASRTTTVLAANGSHANPLAWSDLVPNGWTYGGGQIVQWDTPIPPTEGDELLAKMSASFDHASMYRAGTSYLGKPTWALELMPPIRTTHWSRMKASVFKPTVIYSARQHANEVSSTSHVLRHAELLLTDPAQQNKLDKVNVIIHPFTNPDGAQLAYDLYKATPDYILHAGYLGSLGMDATSGSGQDFPIYPEANIRNKLWKQWLPDIFLNPHGYPSHQVVQLFSEYSGLVRRGRVTERNWGFNKGWFIPSFGYLDDPEFPRHKTAAFELRDYITAGINSNRDVFEMNQRNYDRYRRYGAAFDPDVFRLPMTDSVLIEMPLKGSRNQPGSRGFNSRVTIWSGTTEAPDETAYGAWMQMVAKAGLSWDQAILDYLYEGNHKIERSGSKFFGGVTLKMDRPRPPKTDSSDETNPG